MELILPYKKLTASCFSHCCSEIVPQASGNWSSLSRLCPIPARAPPAHEPTVGAQQAPLSTSLFVGNSHSKEGLVLVEQKPASG